MVFENDVQETKPGKAKQTKEIHFRVCTSDPLSHFCVTLHVEILVVFQSLFFHRISRYFSQLSSNVSPRLPSILHLSRFVFPNFSSNSLSPHGRRKQNQIRNARSYFLPLRKLYVYRIQIVTNISLFFFNFSIAVCISDSGKKQQAKENGNVASLGLNIFYMQTHTQITRG